MDEIRKLMRELNVLQIFHVSREANMVVHAVARFVAREIASFNWLGDELSWIENDKLVTVDFIREVICGVINHNRSFPVV